MKSGRALAMAVVAAGVVLCTAGCGGSDFKNKPRPPAPVQLSGVITDREVTVSPDRLGAGPLVLIISNQTQKAHTVKLEGPGGTAGEKVGPINPLDTARLQITAQQGRYTVSAGSPAAETAAIKPAVLDIGPPRTSSSNQVLLP